MNNATRTKKLNYRPRGGNILACQGKDGAEIHKW
jgi:hypothetical protein